MTDSPDVAHIDVRYVANLARIAITEEEAEAYQRDLDAILEYVAKLGELDVEHIEPTAHAMPQVNVLRDDVPLPTMPREAMLANAPATSDGEQLRVPLVVDDGGNVA